MPQEKMKTQGAWEVYHLCIHNPKDLKKMCITIDVEIYHLYP